MAEPGLCCLFNPVGAARLVFSPAIEPPAQVDLAQGRTASRGSCARGIRALGSRPRDAVWRGEVRRRCWLGFAAAADGCLPQHSSIAAFGCRRGDCRSAAVINYGIVLARLARNW